MTTQFRIRHALIALALAVGCNSASEGDGGTSPDLRPAPDMSSGADTASGTCPSPANWMTTGGACNLVPFPSTRVPFAVQTGTPPTFTGGTLVDGLYTAIKAEGWNVATGSGRQMGMVIGNGGTTMLWFGQTLNADGSGDMTEGTAGIYWLRANYDLSIDSQNTLTLSEICTAGTTSGPPKLLYTATATDPPQLILAAFSATNPTGAVTTYERDGCP
jgi:hypothetical protein